MKVLFILPTLNGGGAERVILNIIRFIDKTKFTPVLFLLKNEGVYWEELPAHVQVIYGHKKNFIGLHYFASIFRFFLAARKADLVIGGLELTASYYAAICGFLLKKPSIGWIHTSMTMYLAKVPFRHSILVKLLYPLLTGFVTVSKGSYMDMIQKYPSLKNHANATIYNCIDLERLKKNSESGNDLLQEKALWPLIVCLGRLDSGKAYDRMVEACKLLRNKNCNFHCRILGDGPEREKLQLLINNLDLQEFVTLEGFISNPYPVLKRATVFAHSSLYEGFAIVLVEAMALGIPVVSTDCPFGPAEVLDGGRYGMLVTPNDAKALADALYYCIGNSGQREKMSREGLFRAEEFSPKKVLPQIESYFSTFA